MVGILCMFCFMSSIWPSYFFDAKPSFVAWKINEIWWKNIIRRPWWFHTSWFHLLHIENWVSIPIFSTELFHLRYELDSNIFAWWCERADGTQDGFAELAPVSGDVVNSEGVHIGIRNEAFQMGVPQIIQFFRHTSSVEVDWTFFLGGTPQIHTDNIILQKVYMRSGWECH